MLQGFNLSLYLLHLSQNQHLL